MFRSIRTPAQARQATEDGALAALLLSILNGLNAVALFWKNEPVPTLTGLPLDALGMVHLAIAGLGLLLYRHAVRAPSAWACCAIAAWVGFEATPGLASMFYGRMPLTVLHWGMLPVALVGLRGVWAWRRLESGALH